METILENASKNPLFVGARHIIDFEMPDWLGRDDVHNGLKALERLNLTYDLLLRYKITICSLGFFSLQILEYMLQVLPSFLLDRVVTI